jgi:GNAT superfamily N-acetyltransferase
MPASSSWGDSADMDLEYRLLERRELSRVREIDRTETIRGRYVQRDETLELQAGDWSAPPWDLDGAGPHSVAALHAMLDSTMERGATALGAFAGARLAALGLVLPHVRPRVAQLVALYVNADERGHGVGGRLCDELERVARDAGDAEMVVSATPSENTVRFYLGRGFAPTAEPLPELYDLEPEDIHMWKQL